MNNHLEKIEKLLYEDEDFRQIEQLTQRTKHYNVLIKENDEATFSRILRFFLDPAEWHGYGDDVLRKFLFLLVDNSRKNNIPGMTLTKIQIEDVNLLNAKVFREFTLGAIGRIDVFVELPNEMVLLIENKLFSEEGENQTNRYYEYANAAFRKEYKNIVYCYVTPDGAFADNEHFTPISFDDIHTIVRQFKSNEPLNPSRFILDIFEEWIMDKKPVSSEIQELCHAVYRNHKATLELIMENAPTISALLKSMSEKINTEQSAFFAHYGSYWLSMSPQQWLVDKKLRETSKYSTVRIQYEYHPERLYLTLVFPNEKEYKEKIDGLAPKLFQKNADEIYSWKNWGKLFYTFEIMDEFIPENLRMDWENRIDEMKEKIVTTCNDVFPQLEKAFLEM